MSTEVLIVDSSRAAGNLIAETLKDGDKNKKLGTIHVELDSLMAQRRLLATPSIGLIITEQRLNHGFSGNDLLGGVCGDPQAPEILRVSTAIARSIQQRVTRIIITCQTMGQAWIERCLQKTSVHAIFTPTDLKSFSDVLISFASSFSDGRAPSVLTHSMLCSCTPQEERTFINGKGSTLAQVIGNFRYVAKDALITHFGTNFMPGTLNRLRANRNNTQIP